MAPGYATSKAPRIHGWYAQGRKQASPGSKTRGVWIDGNGDGLYTPGVDGVIMVDTYLLSDDT